MKSLQRYMLWPLLLLVLSAGASAAERKGSPRPASRLLPSSDLFPRRTPPASSHGPLEGVTRCELCHTTSSWANARFAHERTGFPLQGRHAAAPCKSCHANGFTQPLGQRCSGCHRDPHRGELGQRCEGCHQTDTWESQFNADAHRRTAFPLEGRHAFIPCAECHGEARDRRFSRPATECVSCHQDDYQRTALTSINHAALGLSTRCEECHQSFRFSPARFPQHDLCFNISSGSHANLGCRSCHSTLPASASVGSCNTRTAACTGCHEHACARTDARHANVLGYQCVDRKCYECHRSSGGR